MQDIRDELEEKMEAWQQLTRALTHEIMNFVAPIASLVGMASRLLEEDNGDTEEKGGGGRTWIGRRRLSAGATRDALAVIKRRSEALMSFVDA